MQETSTVSFWASPPTTSLLSLVDFSSIALILHVSAEMGCKVRIYVNLFLARLFWFKIWLLTDLKFNEVTRQSRRSISAKK